MMSSTQSGVTIRLARPEDGDVCGRICYEAFAAINRAHNFPPDVPAPEMGIGLLSMMFSAPGVYCVVAEVDRRIVGSNCLDERAVVHGVGPITVDPAAQNHGVGRALMKAVLARASERQAAGVRLVQAAFHSRSLSLYTGLGFDVREPLACLQGPAMGLAFSGIIVRPAVSGDLDACIALSLRIHGFSRADDLAKCVELGLARVVERDGRVTGYSSQLAFFGHSTAESNADVQALIGTAESFGGPGILVPTRNSELLRWCLAHGLRIVQPMTLMSMGLYNEPRGSWLPSVMF